MEVSFEIINSPSRSKGWWRYKATDNTGRNVIQSRTGNEWVSAPHSGELEPGTEFAVTVQMELNVGKGRTRRAERQEKTLHMIADPGMTAEIGTGASYFRARVNGARLLE